MNTQSLTQRALAAHHETAAASAAQNREADALAVEEAQNVTAGYVKRLLEVNLDPNEIGVFLIRQSSGSRTDFEIDGLRFCCEIRTEPGPRQVVKLYFINGTNRHPITGLADLGKVLAAAASTAHPTAAPETTSGA